jgi:hypothetical protein
VSIFVFLGPTLPRDQAKAILDAHYLPPVRTGDVYRLAKLQPRAIVIIDGYFDRVPAVWHKEILWAMKEGIHVFGASSMGALRAAELHTFGMEGVGQIFENFASGKLEDDDEVAVAHTQADEGYQSLSVAMVDIRATLQKAHDAGIITQSLHDALIQHVKAQFYPHRNYQLIVRYIRDHSDDLTKFEQWLDDHQVHQKQLDAKQVLQVVRNRFATPQAPKVVDYAFENSAMWSNLQRHAGTVQFGQDGGLTDDWVLDELRLDQAMYHRLMRLALLQVAATELLDPDDSNDTDVQQTVNQFFEQRGIAPHQAQAWLQLNNLTPVMLSQIVNDYTKIETLTHTRRTDIIETLPNILKLSGMYPQLATRAKQKQKQLQDNYLDMPNIADVGVTLEQLYQWYFVEQLNLPSVPDDVEQYAKLSGFEHETAFKRALLRDYCIKVVL